MPKAYNDIKPIDIHQRPFKSYKRYRMSDVGTGFVTHSGVHGDFRIDIFDPATGDAVGTNTAYPTNADGTNKYVAYRAIGHRYYNDVTYDLKDPVNTKSYGAEHCSNSKTKRILHVSASSISCPYNEVGEQIKPNSITFVTGIGDVVTTIEDDGEGNLRDGEIATSSFASASNNFLYLSFNNEFRQSEKKLTDSLSETVPYILNDTIQIASGSGIQLVEGIVTSGDFEQPSGFAGRFQETDFIEIPHTEEFNKFNRLDDWTISFWFNVVSAGPSLETVLSKGGIRNLELIPGQSTLPPNNNVVGFRGKKINTSLPSHTITASMAQHRTPFAIGIEVHGLGAESASLHFQSSDGTNALYISSSNLDAVGLGWHHFAIRNSGSNCIIYTNGVASGTTGSLPPHSTANNAQLRIGQYSGSSSTTGIGISNHDFAEFRMYDYGASETHLSSLSNRHFISASCYQTNIVGNAFYKNGQLVVSTPLPKYNTGSGAFEEMTSLTYRGTHTIYENQVMVRIPKGEFNVSTNPTATYTPVEGKELTEAEQTRRPPGDRVKSIFNNEFIMPYITTVGLYNDSNELLAIGKLAQPIQKRNDVDSNIIVRWDY